MIAGGVITMCIVAIILILQSEYKIDIRKKKIAPSDEVPIREKKKNKVARVGISVPDKRQMKSLGDSCLESKDIAKKGNTFEPSQNEESDPDPKDLVIDADPTESVIDDDEEITVYTGGELYTAGGVDYDVMMKTVKVVNSRTATKEEEQKAGQVLHDNRDTELVSKMQACKGALANRISTLLDLRTQGYIDSLDGGVASHSNESDDYKNFNADEYF